MYRFHIHQDESPRTGPVTGSATGSVVGLMLVLLFAVGCSEPGDRTRAHMERGREHTTAGLFDKARVEFRNVLKIDPRDARGRMALAGTLEHLGDFQGALGQYMRIVPDHPDHAEARVHAGFLLLAVKQTEKALSLAEEALAIDSRNARAYALRGFSHVALRRPEEADRDAEAALEADPYDIQAVNFSAWLAGQRGDIEQATAMVKRAEEKHPGSRTLRLLEADLLGRAGRHDEAIKVMGEQIRTEPAAQQASLRLRLAAYLDRLGRYDKAEATLRGAVERHAEDPAPVIALAEFLIARKDSEQAERLLLAMATTRTSPAPFQRALASLYEHTGQTEKVEAILRRTIDEHGTNAPGLEARTALAKIRAGQSRLDEARELLEPVLAENPLDKAALTLRAKLALLRGALPQAIGDLRTVVRDAPRAIEAMWLLGEAHRRNGELNAAEQQFRNALSVAPMALTVRLALVQLLAGQGNLDEARALTQEALARDPVNQPLLAMFGRLSMAVQDWAAIAETGAKLRKAHPDDALGDYLEGAAAQASGDYRRAAEAFERASDLAPGNTVALGALVQSLVTDGRAESALKSLRVAAELTPNDPAVLRMLGRLLRGLGQLEAAETTMNRALALAPNVPAAHWELSLALRGQGKMPEALAVLEAGLSTNNDSELILTELGLLYDAVGRSEDSITLYEGYLERHPDSLTTVNNLAMLLATRRADRASLDRASELSALLRGSEEATFLDTMGWVHYLRGETDRAVVVLEDVVARSPEVPSFQFHLGAALIAKGHVQRGREHLENSLGSRAPFPERDEAVALLERVASPR